MPSESKQKEGPTPKVELEEVRLEGDASQDDESANDTIDEKRRRATA